MAVAIDKEQEKANAAKLNEQHGQAIAKAIGLKQGKNPNVLDVTAGLACSTVSILKVINARGLIFSLTVRADSFVWNAGEGPVLAK